MIKTTNVSARHRYIRTTSYIRG